MKRLRARSCWARIRQFLRRVLLGKRTRGGEMSDNSRGSDEDRKTGELAQSDDAKIRIERITELAVSMSGSAPSADPAEHPVTRADFERALLKLGKLAKKS